MEKKKLVSPPRERAATHAYDTDKNSIAATTAAATALNSTALLPATIVTRTTVCELAVGLTAHTALLLQEPVASFAQHIPTHTSTELVWHLLLLLLIHCSLQKCVLHYAWRASATHATTAPALNQLAVSLHHHHCCNHHQQ
jgi:hypothetical protein